MLSLVTPVDKPDCKQEEEIQKESDNREIKCPLLWISWECSGSWGMYVRDADCFVFKAICFGP